MIKKKLSYYTWPIIIVSFLVYVIVKIVWTINVALEQPVQEENAYMMKYQELDHKFAEISDAKNRFESKYECNIFYELKKGINSINIEIVEKESRKKIENAQIKLLLTRVETNNLDMEIPIKGYFDGKYVSQEFNVEKIGRWRLIAKVEVDNDYKFFDIKSKLE